MSLFKQANAPSLKNCIHRAASGPWNLSILAFLLLVPLAAHAQGSPFDNGFTALQTLFTGTVAKVQNGGFEQEHPIG